MTDPETPYPAYHQIADYFEEQIENGTLKESDRLPSTLELTRKFKASSKTIQLSLNLLTERGLIERSPKRGTFVRRGLGDRTLGIVFGRGLFYYPEHLHQRYILEQVLQQAIASGWKYELFPIPENAEYDAIFHRLKKAVSSASIRAAIEMCAPQSVVEYLRECPVPLIEEAYEIDWVGVAGMGIRYLLEHGAGRIVVFDISARPETQENRVMNEMKTCFAQLTKTTGVPIELVAIRREDVPDSEKIFRIAKQKLSGPGRPDSILVLKDILLHDILFSIYETGLRVPRDLHLLSHMNKGLSLFTPFPMTALELDPLLMSKMMMQNVTETVDGGNYRKGQIPCHLRPGISCGE